MVLKLFKFNKKNMFNELYYWMCFYAKKNKSDEIASFGALVAFSFFLFLNLTAISFFQYRIPEFL